MCDWIGDEPRIAHPEYEDGGWECCPNGCVDGEGEPTAVVYNFYHPAVQAMYAKALKKVWGMK